MECQQWDDGGGAKQVNTNMYVLIHRRRSWASSSGHQRTLMGCMWGVIRCVVEGEVMVPSVSFKPLPSHFLLGWKWLFWNLFIETLWSHFCLLKILSNAYTFWLTLRSTIQWKILRHKLNHSIVRDTRVSYVDVEVCVDSVLKIWVSQNLSEISLPKQISTYYGKVIRKSSVPSTLGVAVSLLLELE